MSTATRLPRKGPVHLDFRSSATQSARPAITLVRPENQTAVAGLSSFNTNKGETIWMRR